MGWWLMTLDEGGMERRDGKEGWKGGMERSDSEIFGSYQPVLNTSIFSILWGDNLAIILTASTYAVLT